MSTNIIKGINPKIPKFELPVYEGKRYEAIVPDTLDLAERAALALNSMGGSIDPDIDYVMT